MIFQECNNQSRTWCAKVANRDNVAAFDLIDGNIGQIDGGAHSRLARFYVAPVTLNGANTCFEIRSDKRDPLSAAKASTGQGSGYNRADSAQGKRPIDKQARLPISRCGSALASSLASASSSSAIPQPVRTEVGTIGRLCKSCAMQMAPNFR